MSAFWADHDRLLFHEGVGRTVARLTRNADELAPRLVTATDGTELGRVVLRPRTGGKRVGDLIAMVAGGDHSGRAYTAVLQDVRGPELLVLEISNSGVRVTGPGGEVGDLLSLRRGGGMAVDMRAPAPGFWKRGALLAQVRAKGPEQDGEHAFTWDLTDSGTRRLATVSHPAGGRGVNTLAFEPAVGEPTRTLPMAFAAALFDRYWMLTRAPTPG